SWSSIPAAADGWMSARTGSKGQENDKTGFGSGEKDGKPCGKRQESCKFNKEIRTLFCYDTDSDAGGKKFPSDDKMCCNDKEKQDEKSKNRYCGSGQTGPRACKQSGFQCSG